MYMINGRSEYLHTYKDSGITVVYFFHSVGRGEGSQMHRCGDQIWKIKLNVTCHSLIILTNMSRYMDLFRHFF